MASISIWDAPTNPLSKVVGGADMIRHPERAAAIIAAAKMSKLPVSVKTRLGYTYVDEWRAWLTFILQQDIAALTIHLRTKREMSKVPAHVELIPDIMALRDEIAPHTLIIINGDVRDQAHGMELADAHGVDGIMIGRGVFANPFVFSSKAQEADRNTSSQNKTALVELLRYHLDQFDLYQPQMGRPFETLKRFFKVYIRDFDGASNVREQLMHCTNTTETRAILDSVSK